MPCLGIVNFSMKMQDSENSSNKPEWVFQLTYRKLEIGTLSLKDGEWSFWYSEAFKAQDKIKPLTDFPNLYKVYTSEDLYPLLPFPALALGRPSFRKPSNVKTLTRTTKRNS